MPPTAVARMPFRNLYFQFADFRNHNFCDFFNRLEEVKDESLETMYREGYFGRGIEPYFEPIIPLTLHPTSCAGFFRTAPKWPINERDYYLSKLFQFLYSPIEVKYQLDYSGEDKVTRELEKILDQIPDDVLPQLNRWDWWDFYEDTFNLDLDPLLERLSGRLQEFCQRVEQGLPVESASEDGSQPPRRHRRRQPETVERDSIVLHCLARKMDRLEICRMLDQKAIPTAPALQAKGIHRWVDGWTNLDTRNSVQRMISKAKKKGECQVPGVST